LVFELVWLSELRWVAFDGGARLVGLRSSVSVPVKRVGGSDGCVAQKDLVVCVFLLAKLLVNVSDVLRYGQS
jgi:ABC-type taurine transport system substrate-binding protein